MIALTVPRFPRGLLLRRNIGKHDVTVSMIVMRHSNGMEVAAGLEPTKTGFADQRLDRFGIATKLAIPKSVPKSVPKMP